MNKNQIIEIIRANQSLPYAEVKRHADEAGILQKQFEDAWRSAKLDSSLDHDARIDQISVEMEALGKDSKDISGWKEYFLSKGYLDDETDIAYVLARVEIKYKPTSFMIFIFVLLAAAEVLMIYLAIKDSAYRDLRINSLSSLSSRNDNEFNPLTAAFVIPFGAFLTYLLYIGNQLRKATANIINMDFNASQAFELPEWRLMGSKLLSYPSAKITSLFSMKYDNRDTYYGEYQYTVGSGKHRHTYFYSFIAQKAHKELPLVHCFSPSLDRTFFAGEVQLEGNEFNKVYNIYAVLPQDAFYVFNPRVMTALLEPEVKKEIKSFETVGNYIIMAFSSLTLCTPIRFKKPYIRFSDYEAIKEKMLHRLDLASDINDTLSRLIVDSGEKRSVAKHK